MGKVFSDLSLLVLPFLLPGEKDPIIYEKVMMTTKRPYVSWLTYLSSDFGAFALVATSHNFTVQSAEPDARREPSQLQGR